MGKGWLKDLQILFFSFLLHLPLCHLRKTMLGMVSGRNCVAELGTRSFIGSHVSLVMFILIPLDRKSSLIEYLHFSVSHGRQNLCKNNKSNSFV